MKKQLLCTSAIALGVAAAPAAAQDWNLDWGGFYNTHVAHADVGGNDTSSISTTATFAAADFDGVSVVGNAEIVFTPSITLDNGMTFGVTIEMEGQNGGGGADGIDESYVYVSSDTLGRIEMGGENSAGYKLMVGAPSVGSFGINSGSVSTVAPIVHAFRDAGGSSFTEVGGNNDVQRISYFTPDFNGLTVGISYAPGNASNASNTGPFPRGAAAGIVATDIFDIGVNYSGTIGAASVSVGARWGTGDNPANIATPTSTTVNTPSISITPAATPTQATSDLETWGIGFQVGVSGFTFGMAYAENDAGVISGTGDSESIAAGISYDLAGPWTIGLEGFQGETSNGAGVVKTEFNAYKLAGSRQIGPGVSMDVYAISAENKNVGAVAGNTRDATIIGTSLNLSF